MSWYEYDEDNRADHNARVEKKLAQFREEGRPLEPTLPTAKRDLSSTFWGQAWNRNLMAYSHYEARMPKGRTYFRNGSVLGLRITQGQISSLVKGKDLYEVDLFIQPLSPEAWSALKQHCQGKITDLTDLLSGDLSDDVMRVVSDPTEGLFPTDEQIKLTCTCPDYADMCKHCAATLYAVGALLDGNPRHLFTLRGVAPEDLIGTIGTTIDALTQPVAQSADRSDALGAQDLSALFGVHLTEEITPPREKFVK